MPGPGSRRRAAAAALSGLLASAPLSADPTPAPLAAAANPAPAPRGALEILVAGVRSARGSVRVKLVQGDAGFPGSDDGVVEKRRTPAEAGAVRFHLDTLPYGEYALVVLHDEDDDAALGRDWLGLPTEGLGFSSGARVRFGPPSYEEARFRLASPRTEMRIEMQYR